MNKKNSKTWIVYLALTKATTPYQAYIGITGGSLEKRRKQHEQNAKNGKAKAFYEAMREIGIEHFEWSKLPYNLTKEIALQQEGALTEKYKNLGYKVLTKSCSSKRDLLQSHKSVRTNNPKKCSPLTEQEKQQRSLYGKQGNDNPDSQRRQQMAGTRCPVKETNTNRKYVSISEAAKETGDTKASIKRSTIDGTPTRNGNIYQSMNLDGTLKEHQTLAIQRVKCLTLDKVFKDEEAAAKTYRIPSYKIRSICKGKQQYVRWEERQLTFCNLDDQGNEILEERHKKYIEKLEIKAKTHIAAFQLETDYIKPEYSAMDAKTLSKKIKEATGKYPHPSHILEVCDDKRQHSCGFRFTYWDPINRKATVKDRHMNTKISKQFRAVHQLDHENRSIRFWKSLGEAEKSLKISADQIRQCCEGILYTTGSHDKKERLRFAFDKMGKPYLRDKHTEEPGWPGKKIIGYPSLKSYKSIAKWMRDMDLRPKSAKTYLNNTDLNKLEIKGNRWYYDDLPTIKN